MTARVATLMDRRRVCLVNTNRMRPPVAPIALDYLSDALRADGCDVDIVDLALSDDTESDLAAYFRVNSPRLVGLTFRNSDDCFWPSGQSFIPALSDLVRRLRGLTDAPIVLGGNGFSLFPEAILRATGCDFGIRGDGEVSLPLLARSLANGGNLDAIPGLWRRIASSATEGYASTPVLFHALTQGSSRRNAVDNLRYFREGGQGNVETKRGCDGRCVYCADPLAKGHRVRVRRPNDVADEVAILADRGVTVLHLCDSEFNRPYEHALDVCRTLASRRLGVRATWYAYLSIRPFTGELARAMRKAGCVGINFGADSGDDRILTAFGREHRKDDIAAAVRLCRENGMAVMLDLLLGGPDETPETLRTTIEFMKAIGPDCVGSALGVRLCPGTAFTERLMREGPLSANPHLRRRREAPPLDAAGDAEPALALAHPTFYINRALGEQPAQLVREMIAGDTRFFEPMDEQGAANYNYNDNAPLLAAIRSGARGAYWDILRKMR